MSGFVSDTVQGFDCFVCVLMLVQSAGSVSWSQWSRSWRRRSAFAGLLGVVWPLPWYQSCYALQLGRC